MISKRNKFAPAAQEHHYVLPLCELTRALVGGGLFLAPPQVFSQYLVY